jgi:hypothetical protein
MTAAMPENHDGRIFEFEEVATTVEERFTRVYDRSFGEAKGPNDGGSADVSTGWWLVMKRMGIALWIGKEKPEISTGDLLSISIRKLG